MEITLHGLARHKEHLENLKEVLEHLSQAGLKLKPKKCHLMQHKVIYLGYVVTEAGISADPGKVKAVRDFLVPRDLK